MSHLYCPKCGLPAEKRDGVWHCASGGLEFSLHLGDRLEAEYGASAKSGRTPAPTDLRSSAWYCPACCRVLDDERQCPECQKQLSPSLHYHLVEFHPHAKPDGGFF